MQDGDDPDIGAFCAVASLPALAQGRLRDSLARLFRPSSSNAAASSSPAAASAPLARASSAAAAPTNHHPHHKATLASILDDAIADWSTAPHGGGPVERAAFPHAALAVHQQVAQCIHLCPYSYSSSCAAAVLPTTTLARVVPYTLFAADAFVAVKGSISNTAELARRFAARSGGGAGTGAPPPSSSSSSSSSTSALSLRSARSAPLPSFQAARDAALADEVACLSLTPPGSGLGAGAGGNALLAGVRRAVDAGEATARAVLALYEDAVGGAGARTADSPAQALTLALADVQGSFALVIHDSRRGCTLAARDASGEEPLFFALPSDGGSVVFASRPVDLPSARVRCGDDEEEGEEAEEVEDDGNKAGAGDWHELPAGHFVVLGGGLGRSPRLHQFALTPEQLRARAAAAMQADDGAHDAARARSGVALTSAVAAALTHHGRAAWASSPHSVDSGSAGGLTASARWSSACGEDLIYE
jgi:hypothetical protein